MVGGTAAVADQGLTVKVSSVVESCGGGSPPGLRTKNRYGLDVARTLRVSSVTRSSVRLSTLTVVPGLDHHFMRYASAEAAFAERDGVEGSAPVVAAILEWLKGL